MPDLVLLNLAASDSSPHPLLPIPGEVRLDGLSFVRALRTDLTTSTVPIILLSSNDDEASRIAGMESGANDYLVIPFNPLQIKTRVRTQLELQELRREIAVKQELIRKAEVIRQSEKLAVVGRLASSIAHEINNPLEAITNLLYLAEGTLGSSPEGEYVRQAQAELVRISNITTQTLRFHRQSTNAGLTFLPNVLDGVIVLFRGRPEYANLYIERQYRSPRPIMAFEADLRQVFANIISNAMDASVPGGQITLRVRDASLSTTGEAGVRVTIADNGIGMTEQTRRRIFDPFFTTKGITGTGLGLWVSSEILVNHKACVQVHTTQDQTRHGTVFTIFFPFNGAVAR